MSDNPPVVRRRRPGRRVGADAEVRPRRARHLRRDRRPFGRGVDGRAHERGRSGQDHRQRRGLVLQPLARRACGRRARRRATPSASSKCASTATRTPCGSRSSRRAPPVTPAAAPASTARCRSASKPALPSSSSVRSACSIPKSCIGVRSCAQVSPSPAPPFATAAARGRGGGGRPSRRAGRRRRRRDLPRTYRRSPAPVRAPAASA